MFPSLAGLENSDSASCERKLNVSAVTSPRRSRHASKRRSRKSKSLMDFYRPTSLAEALYLLAQQEGARCLAGGATLVAMMNAGLVEPSGLISLADLRDLFGITSLPDGSVRVGATTRHVDTAQSTIFRAGQRVLPAAAGNIANPPVRTMGTLGGSLAFADPGAD